jgi:hypothetical protein
MMVASIVNGRPGLVVIVAVALVLLFVAFGGHRDTEGPWR